jgi:hypothetical protein
VADDLPHTAARFYAAARSLALHSGSLQERLADAYADHLLPVTRDELPPDLRDSFGELEERMTGSDSDGDEDPFAAAARDMSEADARELIERIVLLYGHLARAAT